MESFNPLMTVNGSSVPCPSTYKWSEEDISASDAGRTEDGAMDKQMIGRVVKLELEWINVSIENGSIILKAFDSEYLTVKYLDAKEGKFVTSTFYAGNRSSPLYNSKLGVWSKIAFNLVARYAVGDRVVSNYVDPEDSDV